MLLHDIDEGSEIVEKHVPRQYLRFIIITLKRVSNIDRNEIKYLRHRELKKNDADSCPISNPKIHHPGTLEA